VPRGHRGRLDHRPAVQPGDRRGRPERDARGGRGGGAGGSRRVRGVDVPAEGEVPHGGCSLSRTEVTGPSESGWVLTAPSVSELCAVPRAPELRHLVRLPGMNVNTAAPSSTAVPAT